MMSIQPILRKYFFFIFLLPVFFVLHNFNENYFLIRTADVVQLIIIYVCIAPLIVLLSWLALRSWRKASVFTFAIMFYYFFFGALMDSVKKFAGEIFLVKYTFILPATAILFILLFIYLKKTKKSFSRLTFFFNFLFFILVIIEGITLANKKNQPTRFQEGLKIADCGNCPKPDIYLIVADEYAGNDELKNILKFDNSSFENELTKRGFHIIEHSKSNYNSTPFSVASMLEMDFIHSIKDYAFDDNSLKDAFEKINDNQFIAILKQLNYKVYNNSIFRVDNQPVLTTSSYATSGKDLITSQTFWGRIDRDIRFNLVTRLKLKSEMERYRISAMRKTNLLIQKTKDAATSDDHSPKFVYLHLMIPHFPYYIDKKGNNNPMEIIFNTTRFNQQDYLGYLQYGNSLFLDLIDHLQKQKEKPIIMFMGDHGFRHFTTEEDSTSKYHFSTLNSIYLPDSSNYPAFYNGMSAVNEFRILLNKQFNQQLPLLKDSTIFLRNWW